MTLHVAIFLQNYYVENIIEKLKNLSLVHNDLIKVLDLFQNIYVGSLYAFGNESRWSGRYYIPILFFESLKIIAILLPTYLAHSIIVIVVVHDK